MQCVIGVILSIGSLVMPESPRYGVVDSLLILTDILMHQVVDRYGQRR